MNSNDYIFYLVLGSIAGSFFTAWVFWLVMGITKQRYYESKQLEILVNIARQQGLPEEDIVKILNRPNLKP